MLCTIKVEDLFLKINLAQVSSFATCILEIYENRRRADNILEVCALLSFTLIVYADGRSRKSA